jgi:cyclic beta-1,2-glucan synthetase
LAQEGIEELNARYRSESDKRFYLFHRRRLWNPKEAKWIGWERKRGKILEFNSLLRGATDTSYLKDSEDPSALAKWALKINIKYVITLDSDTQLPRDAARQLVGTIEHPLNQPYFSPQQKRVISGYGILQPRISVSMQSAARTRFAHIFSGNTGLDPYTTAVSDVYQDLFLEGSYTGKGLYVVDAFAAALAGRVPENTILSHDLFEGSFARSALVTDIELIDDYPADYETFSKRQHRWTRGDWQIIQWLFRRVPNSEGNSVTNDLPLIARWKIFDNLRRSIVPIAILIWLGLAWTVLPGSPVIWTLPLLLMIIFPIYAPMTTGTFLKRHDLPWSRHLSNGLVATRTKAEQILLLVSFLAEQAVNQSDAILRTLYRMLISRKKLLEWVSFAQLTNRKKVASDSLSWADPGPWVAVTIAAFIFVQNRLSIAPGRFHPGTTVFVAAPFLMVWLFAPLIKSWANHKARSHEIPLGPEQIRDFRVYARRTWHFFEAFLSADDHWLAPDNFQEDPQPVLAHRTSPTNIGLQLLSISAAFDFGYIGIFEYIELIENVFLTLEKLQKNHGHFYNWYDTQTLEPLRPQYISTVDSGNLCGHLFTFKQAFQELNHQKLPSSKFREGLLDTLILLRMEADKIQELNLASSAITKEQLFSSLDAAIGLTQAKSPGLPNIEDWTLLLFQLKLKLVESEDILNVLAVGEEPNTFAEMRIWLNAVLHQIAEFHRDLLNFSVTNIYERIVLIMNRCDTIALAMDFHFLFDNSRKIFAIGFDVDNGRRDNSYYDLLASESRLASFIAIAKGDVPKEHWFRLGRQMTAVKDGRALIAWTATIFEYLMPLLVMRRYSDTLLDQTYLTVVSRQIEYGKQQGVPWGISEAGYNARDLHLNYQYGPFGIPGLGLKRGLSDDLVISPYSTMLAAMIQPRAAFKNLQRLERLGVLSKYGFFESVDYTPERLPKNQKKVILRSYMA